MKERHKRQVHLFICHNLSCMKFCVTGAMLISRRNIITVLWYVLPLCIYIYIKFTRDISLKKYPRNSFQLSPFQNSIQSQLVIDPRRLLKIRASLISVWSRWKEHEYYLNADVQSTEQDRIKCAERYSPCSRERKKKERSTQKGIDQI